MVNMISSCAQALKEKEKGNEAYRQKMFDIALQHYDKAIELDSSNMAFLSNKAAVHFELKNYEECRKLCFDAVELGRKNEADFKMIAKALARVGNSYLKENKPSDAIEYFNKSLDEHRNKDILKKFEYCQKLIAEQERLAYINPKLAAEEKEKGNEFFKKGEYEEALVCFDEAIRRDPDSPTLYSVRSACHVKLFDFQSALNDCDQSVEKDSSFIQGHIRKGAVLEAMKDYSRAVDAYQKALDIDPTNEEAGLGVERCLMNDYQINNTSEEIQERMMSNPVVKKILSDPEMASILTEIKNNPDSLLKYTKNQQVSTNIQTLIELGVISVT